MLQEWCGLLGFLLDFEEPLGSFSALCELFLADDPFPGFALQSDQQPM
jgi:hypothetical protein